MTFSWQQICQLGGGRSRLLPATWPYDKYPNTPVLDARKKVVILDREGPGVVTCLHVSNYYKRGNPNLTEDEHDSSVLIIRIWYDGRDKPSIEMPLMDFLGDIESSSGYFSTCYFSKVRQSHNFRLPLPFRKHIRIEIENPADFGFIGYSDVQWEEVADLPDNCGYLVTDYRSGSLNVPRDNLELCNIVGPGAIAAHWLQLEGDDPLCKGGNVICEGNNEFYIDGDLEPSMEYLGTEDFYGYSWGFQGLESDHYSAIIKTDKLPGEGIRVAMLRCRTTDRIQFESSCRAVLEYKHDLRNEMIRKAVEKGGVEAKYRSCYYYYVSQLDE